MKQLYFKDGDGNKLLDNTNRIVLIKATEGDTEEPEDSTGIVWDYSEE